MDKFGVLGLGIIGEIWARNLEADGMLAAVWNRTTKTDFECRVGTPQKVAESANTLIIVVSDPNAVQMVLDQLLPALSPKHLVIQSSTIDPDSSDLFRAQVQATGARYLEAPFTGSKLAAIARETVFYLGGDEAVVADGCAMLSGLSQAQLKIGTNRQAATLKLTMNLQIAAQAEALCEGLSLARNAGVTDDTFFNCLGLNVAHTALADLKAPKLRENDYSPQFSVKHLHKDIRLARTCGIAGESLLLDSVLARLKQAIDAGYGDEDFIALYKLL